MISYKIIDCNQANLDYIWGKKENNFFALTQK